KDYFKDKLLNTNEGKAIGLSYFKERDFNDNIISLFELGYSREFCSKMILRSVRDEFEVNQAFRIAKYILWCFKTAPRSSASVLRVCVLAIYQALFGFNRFHKTYPSRVQYNRSSVLE
ncbi:MAG: hypothetical protein LH647_19425, partial [Leptolyngbyaceae cyanobacterium CAN_BIN12]|nr:hypothetical protein [Leptolyngbyaceae cyanobacterium CAN_BIN12]